MPAPAADDLVASLRSLQDLAGATRPPPEVRAEVAALLQQAGASLAPWRVDDGHPATFAPAFTADEVTPSSVRGRTTFTPFYVGGGGAVHGGAIPLLFDHVLGSLLTPARGLVRTAYLKVDYRALTPIGVELLLDGTVDREEGRKLFLSARLRHGEVVLAEADALFVLPRGG